MNSFFTIFIICYAICASSPTVSIPLSRTSTIDHRHAVYWYAYCFIVCKSQRMTKEKITMKNIWNLAVVKNICVMIAIAGICSDCEQNEWIGELLSSSVSMARHWSYRGMRWSRDVWRRGAKSLKLEIYAHSTFKRNFCDKNKKFVSFNRLTRTLKCKWVQCKWRTFGWYVKTCDFSNFQSQFSSCLKRKRSLPHAIFHRTTWVCLCLCCGTMTWHCVDSISEML